MHTQLSPWLVPALMPATIGRTASRSASSRMIAADLPPSSSTTGLTCSAQVAAIFLPTSVEPVKVTMSTSGWPTRCADPCASVATMFSTPGGKPASRDEVGHREDRQRVGVGRLDHGGAAGDQRRRRLLGDARQREVERAQHCDDADRLAQHQALGLVLHDQPARVTGQRRQVGLAHLGELEVAPELRVVVPVQRRRHGVVDVGEELRVAELVDDEVAEVLAVLGDERGQSLAHLRALLDGALCPVGLVERLARRLDGAIHVRQRTRRRHSRSSPRCSAR